MEYYARDGEQTYGPFTLVQLQNEVRAGRIAPSALVKSEGMPDWRPSPEVLGAISLAPPSLAPRAAAALAPVAVRVRADLPPNLHWGVLLLLSFITQGLFMMVWAAILGNWARKLEKNNRALVLVAMYPAAIVAALVAYANEDDEMGLVLLLGGFIAYYLGVFMIKHVIEGYSSPAGRTPMKLSGVMTLLFSVVYLQYHVNHLARPGRISRISGARLVR
jgi:hypothetical protein